MTPLDGGHDQPDCNLRDTTGYMLKPQLTPVTEDLIETSSVSRTIEIVY